MKVKIKDVQKMSTIERQKKLEDMRNELFKIKSSSAMGGTLQNPPKIREIRRSIARILTVMKINNEV